MTQEDVFKIVNPLLKCRLYNTKADIECYLSVVENHGESYLSLDRREIEIANRNILLNEVLEHKELNELEQELLLKAKDHHDLKKVRTNISNLRANLAHLVKLFSKYKEAKESQINAFERVVNELEGKQLNDTSV